MLASCCLMACCAISAPAENEDAIQKAVASLIDVFRHPDARSSRLEESVRAMKALTAIGKPAVPKLLDAILATNDPAAGYSGNALKEMPAREAEEVIAKRWEKASTLDRWKLVPFYQRFAFDTVAHFALDCFEGKGEEARGHAWGFVILNSKSKAVASAKERYLKALAGDETPRLLWWLLTQDPVFDADKEADILIGLLKADSWVAKGEGRVPPPGGTRPEWPDGRDLVVQILAHRKVKRAVPALIAMLAEKGEGKAYYGDAIIPVLGDFGDKVAIPELKRILTAKPDDKWRGFYAQDKLRALAARALWQLGDTSGRARIAELLKAKQWNDRRFAAETIELCGTKDDIPLLASALDDEDWGVLRATCNGLARITGAKVGDPQFRRGEGDAPHWKEWLKKNK